MTLDGSLFTLTFQRRSGDATLLDLIPLVPSAIASLSNGTPSQPDPLYTFSRARSSEYNVELTDHLTSIPLSSIVASSSADKLRKINLHNPDESIIMERKKKMFRQEWRWKWQEQEYLIRRDGHVYIVEADRNPDPVIE